MDKEVKKAYFDKLKDNIDRFGYQLTYVSAPIPFCYSTGIYLTHKIPEIIISSLPQGICADIADNYVEAFKTKMAIPLNEPLDFLTDKFAVYLIDVPVSNLKDYVLSSAKFYEEQPYKYLQAVYPDTNGNFPTETGYNYDQELMGYFIPKI
ncbi:hypothetical protein GCM10023185_23120 [Hymenobacter saemangeumensis]|uniref:DUF4262 domain-containing protein n=1 Tax=Hymenobacter saemangeumensis TaxID=1084522 RepID=A0ABP8IFQ6_9BACT